MWTIFFTTVKQYIKNPDTKSSQIYDKNVLGWETIMVNLITRTSKRERIENK